MNHQHLTPELMEQLSAVAPGRVFTGSDINVDYSHDEMPIYGKAMPATATCTSTAAAMTWQRTNSRLVPRSSWKLCT